MGCRAASCLQVTSTLAPSSFEHQDPPYAYLSSAVLSDRWSHRPGLCVTASCCCCSQLRSVCLCLLVSLCVLCHARSARPCQYCHLQTRRRDFLDEQILVALQRVNLGPSSKLCLKFLLQITIRFQSLTEDSAPIIAKLALQSLMSCECLYGFTFFRTLRLRSPLSCASFSCRV